MTTDNEEKLVDLGLAPTPTNYPEPAPIDELIDWLGKTMDQPAPLPAHVMFELVDGMSILLAGYVFAHYETPFAVIPDVIDLLTDLTHNKIAALTEVNKKGGIITND